MSNSRFQQTGVKDGKREDIAKSLGSIEYALDCLLDYFVIVSKREFNGISGHFSKTCLSFQRYRVSKVDQSGNGEKESKANQSNNTTRLKV